MRPERVRPVNDFLGTGTELILGIHRGFLSVGTRKQLVPHKAGNNCRYCKDGLQKVQEMTCLIRQWPCGTATGICQILRRGVISAGKVSDPRAGSRCPEEILDISGFR